jgi:hypothetical protein
MKQPANQNERLPLGQRRRADRRKTAAGNDKELYNIISQAHLQFATSYGLCAYFGGFHTLPPDFATFVQTGTPCLHAYCLTSCSSYPISMRFQFGPS